MADASKIGAKHYIECSARTVDDVRESCSTSLVPHCSTAPGKMCLKYVSACKLPGPGILAAAELLSVSLSPLHHSPVRFMPYMSLYNVQQPPNDGRRRRVESRRTLGLRSGRQPRIFCHLCLFHARLYAHAKIAHNTPDVLLA
ncbi:hypothetical protein FIBSPDRAFT_10498 [Athelia psychrophila]|uniref:Uncharacterized protein n=1 Tax=Athelia psychrophila TaxID=1759441 RepID=A0A166X7Z4_9AGAM|nr:hypothetical protein FIBSPDRAFT_10498 [Fibularhizoctonia sp. CBS 109695]